VEIITGRAVDYRMNNVLAHHNWPFLCGYRRCKRI